jgi:hypothetical protein
MLGYSFKVYRKTTDNKASKRLVHWDATPSGLDWLNKLVEEGKAACFDNNGYYPNFYTLQFKELLPIIENKKPPFVNRGLIGNSPETWTMTDNFYTDVEDFLSCDADEYVSLEVWDLS